MAHTKPCLAEPLPESHVAPASGLPALLALLETMTYPEWSTTPPASSCG